MNYEEAVEVLKTIEEVYAGKFPLTKRKVTLWTAELEKMKYDPVMRRLTNHVVKSPFPPTLSEIAVYEVSDNGMAEKMARWKKEAAEVSEETKRLFLEKLDEMERKMDK
ncbi:hypothetical protein [Halobacillus sp. K22]|uniref:hypothetical protein n=1 Tax=Halobacillus sp. K22 TaxID=3457431 RepID=UPI003FCC7862